MEDWDLVVVENGSSDSTGEVLSKYTDPRIRVINLPENIGRTPALNVAVVNASAEYVAVLDADDLSHPLRLKQQIEFLDAHPDVGLVGSWAEFIDEVGLFVSLKKGPISHQEIVQAMAKEIRLFIRRSCSEGI